MKIFRPYKLIGLCAFLLSVQLGLSAELKMEVAFGQLAQKLVVDQETLKNLSKNAALEQREAVAVFSSDGVDHALFIERYPKVLSLQDKKEFVEMQGVNAIVKHQALSVDSVREKLKAFAYQDILIEYAGSRIFSEVNGKVEMQGVSMQFASLENFVAVYIKAPKDSVSVKAVELVASREAKRYYIVALLTRVKAKMTEHKYADSVKLLLEARKYGYASKGLFIDLYRCYARSGDKQNLEKVSNYLLSSRSKELTVDDCILLARAAKENARLTLTKTWFVEAETRVHKGLKLEMLLIEKE